MRRPLADTREEAEDWKRGPHRSVRHHHKDTVSVRIVVEPTPASLTDVKPWLLHAWTYDPAEARAYIEAQGRLGAGWPGGRPHSGSSTPNRQPQPSSTRPSTSGCWPSDVRNCTRPTRHLSPPSSQLGR